MKTNSGKHLSVFQKLMVVLIPIIVLLLISALVMCLAFIVLPMSSADFLNTGNLTIVFAAISAFLAILGIVFAIFNKGKDDDE